MTGPKRNHPRNPPERSCWIGLVAGGPLIACRTYNVTESTATLAFQAPELIPDSFNLYLTRDGKVGRQCRVIWRSSRELGVQFLSRDVSPPGSTVIIET